MLDYSSSSTRKWAMTGVVFICFSVLTGIRISNTHVSGALKKQTAVIRLAGTTRQPVLVFDSMGTARSCPVKRCQYDNWRNDLGAMAEVFIDEDTQVSAVIVGGVTRFDRADLKDRSNMTLALAVFLALIGVCMCANAWRLVWKFNGV